MLHEPSTPLEKVALRAGLLTLSIAALLAFSPLFLGSELDCWPRLGGLTLDMLSIGYVAALIALVAAVVSAVGAWAWENRLAGAFIFSFSAVVLSVPLAAFATDNVVRGFNGSHTDFGHCHPSGALGLVPSAWDALYEVAGAGSIDRADWWDEATRKPDRPHCILTPEGCSLFP